MNERTKELLIKAIKEIGPDDDDKGAKEKTLEMFAELVVQECCDIFLELRTRPADLAVLDVKKYFGIE
jgi:hypothetical protein